MWLGGHSRSLKLVPLESLGAVSYSPSIVTMAVSVAVCEIFTVKEWCDLENYLLFLKTGSQAVLPVLDGMEHGHKCLVSALA